MHIAINLTFSASVLLVLVSYSFVVITPVFAEEISADVVSSTGVFYDPDPINAKVGDTVTWTNIDSQPHTVTSGSNGSPDGKFDSSPNFKPLMVPQGTFSHTFTETGNYPYYCALHPNMIGTVMVTSDQPSLQESSVTVTVDGTDYQITAKSATTKLTEASVESGQDYTTSFDKAGDVELTLPKAVFSEVTSVKSGDQEVDYEVISENESTITVSFQVPEDNMTIVIVPEFPIVAFLMAAGIGGIIAFHRLTRNRNALF